MARRNYVRDTSDYGEFFVERERQHRFRNNIGPGSTTGSRNGSAGRNSTPNFDDEEIYYFGVVQLSLSKVAQILSANSPPPDYIQLSPVERAAYLYYFTHYRKYFTPVDVFHRVFNREFFKYTAAGDSDDLALWKICRHTHEEYKRQLLKQREEAYNKSQKHLFSDERDSPESRNSERQSVCGNDSDLNSIDSISKESQVNGPLLHRVPHAFMRFAAGGKIVYLNPEKSVTTVNIDDAKNFYLDSVNQRNIDAVESFKGPMLVGRTPPQAALLFIQRQIDRIRRSDIYRGNQQSGDANDCLLIWKLLEILIRQQGKVTGPDLASLLIADYSYSSFTTQNFLRGAGASERMSANGVDGAELRNEQNVNLHAMDKFTQFLLGGHIEEALDSAMRDGLLFDALILANRLYRNDLKKLSEIEMKLLHYRAQQHPVMTLLNVAGGMTVPLLTNTTAEDASGWRAHIAIVLANLQSDAAINTVYQLGLALAQKEFNSAADFCFLSVNLLTGKDCCFSCTANFWFYDNSDGDIDRKHIKLISASLPDYDSTETPFGWSILDYQATEIFEYTQSMAAQNQPTALSQSVEFQKCRLQYAKMISTYGGLATNVSLYCSQIAQSIWHRIDGVDRKFIKELYELANRHRYIGNLENRDSSWIDSLHTYISENQTCSTSAAQIVATTAKPMNVDMLSTLANETLDPMNPPLGMSTPLINGSLADVSRAHDKAVDSFNRSKRVSDATSVAAESLYNNQPPQMNHVEVPYDHYVAPVPPMEVNAVEPKAAVSLPQSNVPPPANVAVPANIPMPSTHGYYYGGGYSDPSTPISRDIPSQLSAAQPPVENQMDGLNIGDSVMPPVIHPTYDAYDQFSQYGGSLPIADSYTSNNTDVLDRSGADLQQQSIASLEKPVAVSTTQNNSGGLLSGLTKRLVKYIPSSNAMNLPDDKDPQITWDPDRQRYVGSGVEHDVALPPPPTDFLTKSPDSGVPPNAMQSASSEPPPAFDASGGMPPIPMFPIPIPDGATLPSTVAPKRNSRLPQKRYVNAGFNK